MKRLTNQSGSILVMVIVVMAVMLTFIASFTTYFSHMTAQTQRYFISRENLRIGEALAELVAAAYEYGEQIVSEAGATCTARGYYSYAINGNDFCFRSDTTATGWVSHQASNCVTSVINSNRICLDLSTPPTSPIVATNENQNDLSNSNDKVVFNGNWQTSKKQNPLLGLFLPIADAQVDIYMPSSPTGISNTVTSITCTGEGTPNTECRACGAGTQHVCFEVRYCPANQPSCSTRIVMGTMIRKNSDM